MSGSGTRRGRPTLSAAGERARREREERLARELRANLRRRRAQRQGRSRGAGENAGTSQEPIAGRGRESPGED